MSGLCEHAYLFNNCPFCVIKRLKLENLHLEANFVKQHLKLLAQQAQLKEDLAYANRRAGQLQRALNEGRTSGAGRREIEAFRESNRKLRAKLKQMTEQLAEQQKYKKAA